MAFKLKLSRLARRKKIIDDGIEAAARWPKSARDEYLDRSCQELRDDALTPEILDTFRFDMLKAKKAKTLMGAMAANRRML